MKYGHLVKTLFGMIQYLNQNTEAPISCFAFRKSVFINPGASKVKQIEGTSRLVLTVIINGSFYFINLEWNEDPTQDVPINPGSKQ